MRVSSSPGRQMNVRLPVGKQARLQRWAAAHPGIVSKLRCGHHRQRPDTSRTATHSGAVAGPGPYLATEKSQVSAICHRFARPNLESRSSPPGA